MSTRNPARPPPIVSQTTAAQILKQTTTIFCSNIITLVFLSFLIFCFRSNVHSASHYLASFVDGDPSLKSVLSRIDISAPDHLTQHKRNQLHHNHPYRRRRAFLHLSRVGTLDDDFFSGDSDFDRSLFHPTSKKLTVNATSVIISRFKNDYGFSGSVVDNGISFPGIVKPRGFGFNTDFRNNTTLQQEEEVEVEEEEGMQIIETKPRERNGVFDLEFLIKGLEMGHRDATSLLFFVGMLSAAYAYIVFAFIVTYAWVNGITFIKVVDHLVGNYRPFPTLFWDGTHMGLKRLAGFTVMRWAVRDALAQIMGIFFFGEIEDQYMFFKVFLRMKFMPFANLAPWVIGYELESSCFIAVWSLCELILGFIFAVDAWVAIVDARRGGREILTEGFHLSLVLFRPAFSIRLLETIVCGWAGGWMFKKVFGSALTLFFQSLMEVYFLVAWLVFYLAARHKDDASLGRAFGQRELEGLLVAAR